MKLAR